MSEYTVISFAPVQGFIEKSRKLRDLFGASLILSYLSYQIVQEAQDLNLPIISPGSIDYQKGMPNRILIKGDFPRQEVAKILLKSWKTILEECRNWIEERIQTQPQYHWQEVWKRWEMYTWEVFWGHGDSPEAAMKNLETRKLRRDWTAINWTGESSSLTGVDAIAWPGLGQPMIPMGRTFNEEEKQKIQDFYDCLAYLLDVRSRQDIPLEELPQRISPQTKKLEDFEPEGKYLAPNERLSVPELVVRLVTYDEIAANIGIARLPQGFTPIARLPEEDMPQGRWTGWFMGDGDKMGNIVKRFTQDEDIQNFSEKIREWGRAFDQKYLDSEQGRIVYAGGDDFLGVLYRPKEKPELTPPEVLEWVEQLPTEWAELQRQLQEELEVNLTFSVGLVWAAPGVPQRDVLQHCREAEKRAKKQGRDRITIRVLFNSGQYVQWTCPWEFLHIIKTYRDREGGNNWSQVYNDLAHLQSRRAIDLQSKDEDVDEAMALTLFDLYFRGQGERKTEKYRDYLYDKVLEKVPDDEKPKQLVNWIKDLIEVGWQLCSST